MRKSQLIERLNRIDGDPEVMLSIDAEGNGFSPAADVEDSGLSSDGEPCHPDDVDDSKPRVIVIWP